MNSETKNLRDLKKMRLDRQWSQEQLAEMSGLSIRTIQRIEKGENAGLESIKSLAAVFETNIKDSNKEEELEQIRKEEIYIQKLKNFYKILVLAFVNLLVFFFIAINDSDSDGWYLFGYMVVTWAIFLGIYSFSNFDFFGEEWKKKMIAKKLKKN